MREHSMLMAEKLRPPANPAAEALALVMEASSLLARADRERREGGMAWRAAVSYKMAVRALEAASERCCEAALEVWPLQVYSRQATGDSEEGY